MRNPPRRIAYFPDSFHEVNGVAHTSRNFQAFAERHNLPFLCVRAGPHPGSSARGSVHILELGRSAAAFALEKDLRFDPLFARHRKTISHALHQFKPEIIHITGPSELGIFGAWFAWKYKLPLAASWHTNLHEYAARRAAPFTRAVPAVEGLTERATLRATARFYRLAKVLFAPNRELCDLLARATGKHVALMQRGVDTELFQPAHRTRSAGDNTLVLGYVGRLSIEKNVMLLPEVERSLRARGITNTRFRIIGHGGSSDALRAALPDAEFPGVLRGHELSRAYADMDLFVFPSTTDTFGNVVLEALASGVPAIVTRGGGPKFIVQDGVTGMVCDPAQFADCIADLVAEPERLRQMRSAARAYAETCSWDAVFERVLDEYERILPGGGQGSAEPS